ncbi:MAG: SPOR domain-containing protein [Hyphomicrobiales bacterium]
MSESSGDTKTAPLADDDPLAELAKLVSAGSVFGLPVDSPAEAGPADVGAVDALAVAGEGEPRLTAPAAEALDASNTATLDLDAELGAQLEAELVSELYESEPPVAQPQSEAAAFAAPATDAMVEAPAALAPTADEQISSALDEALNLDGFVSDAPIQAEIPQVAQEPAPVAAPNVDVEPQIDFDSFEAEIAAAAATSGFPAVDAPAPAPSVDVPSGGFVEPSVDPIVETAPTPDLGHEGVSLDGPAALSTGDVDPLDNIQFETAKDDMAAGFDNDNKSGGKGILAIAAVLLVALVGGAGAFFIGAFGDGSDEPVVVAADENPVRVKPDDPGGRQIPDQDRTVYNTLDGEEGDEKPESRLVVRSEEPEVGDSNRPRLILPGSNDGDVSATVPPRGPRTVKTVIVRPDGTLVRPEETTSDVAASASTETSLVDTAETAVAAAGEELTPRAVSTESLSTEETNAETVEAPAQETVQVAALPPVPRANNDRNRAARTQTQTTQTAAAAPAPAAASTPAVNSGEFMVQLSSQRSDEAARTNFRRLQQRHSVLSGYSLNVQRADLGDRGVYHRVRVGPFARSAANTLCERVKSQGGDCIVRRQ